MRPDVALADEEPLVLAVADIDRVPETERVPLDDFDDELLEDPVALAVPDIERVPETERVALDEMDCEPVEDCDRLEETEELCEAVDGLRGRGGGSQTSRHRLRRRVRTCARLSLRRRAANRGAA